MYHLQVVSHFRDMAADIRAVCADAAANSIVESGQVRDWWQSWRRLYLLDDSRVLERLFAEEAHTVADLCSSQFSLVAGAKMRGNGSRNDSILTASADESAMRGIITKEVHFAASLQIKQRMEGENEEEDRAAQ